MRDTKKEQSIRKLLKALYDSSLKDNRLSKDREEAIVKSEKLIAELYSTKNPKFYYCEPERVRYPNLKGFGICEV